MAKKLGEVTPEHLHGTQYSDFFTIEHFFDYPGINFWSREVYLYAGDDFLIFNPTIWSTTKSPPPLLFDGGSGTDWLSLAPVDEDIVIDLGQNYGRIEMPDTMYWDGSAGQWKVTDQTIHFDVYHFENVTGGSGNDKIRGNNWDNVINGMSGNDTLYGHGGEDIISGGDDHDRIYGGDDNDTLAGNDGDDRLWGDGGNDYMGGGDGEDTLEGGSGADTIFGGEDDDVIWGASGNDMLEGDGGNDTISGGTGFDIAVYETNGDVEVLLWNNSATGALGTDEIYSVEGVVSDSGDDTIEGNNQGNYLVLGSGDDFSDGHSGNDTILGGDGNDTIKGGLHNDMLYGGEHADSILGEDGDDFLTGEHGNDTLNGGTGEDTVHGGEGNDSIRGGSGADWIIAGDGHDTVIAGSQDDWVEGGEGNDSITGGTGDDTLYGDAGNDTLIGNGNDDVIYTGSGNNFVEGGHGNDVIYLGSGTDILHWGSGQDNGYDSIHDFDEETDKLSFDLDMFGPYGVLANGGSALSAYVNASQVGNHTWLTAWIYDPVADDLHFESLATLNFADAATIQDRIESGDIFHGTTPGLEWNPASPGNAGDGPFGWGAEDTADVPDQRYEVATLDFGGMLQEDVFLF